MPLGGGGFVEEDLRAALTSIIDAIRNDLRASGVTAEPELAVSA